MTKEKCEGNECWKKDKQRFGPKRENKRVWRVAKVEGVWHLSLEARLRPLSPLCMFLLSSPSLDMPFLGSRSLLLVLALIIPSGESLI